MKKNLLFCSLLLFMFFGERHIFAQTLPPNQPEQDACDALEICGNFYTPYSYDGEGQVIDLPNTPCNYGEQNSVWFRLEVNSAGIIVFEIQPNDPLDDYDFAVMDITNGNCNNIQYNQVIRCNFNNNEQPNNYYANGIVGLNTTSNLLYVMGGAFGQPFLQEINANAGDVYLIMINNFGHDNCYGSCPGSGFTLDFTGSTATFNQPPPPQFDSLQNTCDLSRSIIINVSQNTKCNSIAPDGSDFYLTPSGVVASAEGVSCGNNNGGYTQQVKVTFANPLPIGNYAIHAQTGSDGNTLLGLCDAELQTPDSLQFHVGGYINMMRIDSPACQTLHLHLSNPVSCSSIAANGSDFSVVGPSTVVVEGASGVGCGSSGMTKKVDVHLQNPIPVDGRYKLKVKMGSDGNTLVDTCSKKVRVGDFLPFYVNSFNGLLSAGPDTVTCNQKVTLFAQNNANPPAGGFQYTWTPSNSYLDDPHDPNTPLVLVPGFNYYVLSTIDNAGCYLRDSLIIRMVPFNGTITPEEAKVCTGQKVNLSVSGGTSYLWSENPQFSNRLEYLSCLHCTHPIADGLPVGDHTFYVKLTNKIGCKDTLTSLIHVLPNPPVASIPNDTTIHYGDGIYLHATGAFWYNWQPVENINDAMSPDPYVFPKKSTQYIVSGSDKNGCVGRDTSYVKIDYTSPIFVPNAFSPNGDGVNDVFKIENLTFQKVLVFRVFNRWGQLVFQTTQPDKGWDGTVNGQPAAQGTYNYYIELGYPTNKTKVFKGTVTLLR